MKTKAMLIVLTILVCQVAQAVDFTLLNQKVIKNAIVIDRTNNLVRLLHDEGDNTYQMEYFTKDSQKMLSTIPVNHEKRKELVRIKEEEKKKRMDRLKLKGHIKPPFPVVPYNIEYQGGRVASMSISNVVDETVRVDIISGRIVRNTVMMKPKEVKKRVLFRHDKGNRVTVKAGDKSKIFDVR